MSPIVEVKNVHDEWVFASDLNQPFLSAMINAIPGGGPLGLWPAFNRWWANEMLIQDWCSMWSAR